MAQAGEMLSKKYDRVTTGLGRIKGRRSLMRTFAAGKQDQPIAGLECLRMSPAFIVTPLK